MKRSALLEVSDHCLLRYIQRVLGVDVDAIRGEITALLEPAAKAGATKFSADGMTFVLVNNRVVTVTGGESPSSARLKGRQANGRPVHKPHGGREYRRERIGEVDE